MYHVFFIHSSVDGHLGCVYVLASLNSAAHDGGSPVGAWVVGGSPLGSGAAVLEAPLGVIPLGGHN